MTDFIGSRFGDDLQIEVINKTTKKGRVSYTIKCHVCCNDSELFGSAEYNYSKTQLWGGNLPCGCSKNVQWTSEQYLIRIRRQCVKANCVLVEIPAGKIGSMTKLTLKCNVDGNVWSTTRVSHFLNGTGCPQCRNTFLTEVNRIDDCTTQEQLMATGKFADGTKFWRSDRRDHQGSFQYWNYSCPTCSNDKYVKAGVCTGVFEALRTNLIVGKRSCRCSPAYKWTQAQREVQMVGIIQSEKLPYKFIGWSTLDGYKDSHSKALLFCEHHGNFPADVNSFLNGRRCPSCAKTGYDKSKQGYLYVLSVSGITSSFTGYGITNNIKTRMATHRAKLLQYGYEIISSRVFTSSGEEVQSLEKLIGKAFTVVPQEVKGFIKEATYSKHYDDVIAFAENWQASLPSVAQHEQHTHDDSLVDCCPTLTD